MPPPAPFIFTSDGPYSGFMNDAPHPVQYWGTTYETLTHLFEASKYIGHEPDCVEMLLKCKNTDEVRAMSAQFERDGKARADWESISLVMVEFMLNAKFTQHPALKQLLLETPNGQLIYGDSVDGYWGLGADGSGSNVLGKTLDKVKTSLRAHVYN
ncbi:hypothetical protein AMATHDRAFT_145116 [Amanita thiersii Skay4041]|uniref:NADAR domain-containing protein n=1 Tax=Amanita thiersii Skay4041 TaxID=703135 RepID=A0A2A9NHF5_9AGAR|nr:hypothetical protein AMATHDRAFT_145116 [Amanita thiersii Skay4041]